MSRAEYASSYVKTTADREAASSFVKTTADREVAESTEGIGREARGIQIREPAERARLSIYFSVLSVNSARDIRILNGYLLQQAPGKLFLIRS